MAKKSEEACYSKGFVAIADDFEVDGVLEECVG